MRRLVIGAAVIVGIVLSGGVVATAQHNHDAPSTPIGGSPYAERFDPTATIRSLTPAEIAQIERGEGAGFALPAELNGVPGPRHVLDLSHELGLSHAQVAQVQAVSDEMRAAVIPAGQRYLDALAALEEDFRARTLTDQELPLRVAEVKRLEGELVAAHLAAHLKTAEVLTPEQIARYNQLRGYA